MRSDLAFMFPGQGSQRVGMLGEAIAEFPEAATVFEECSDALGFDLKALVTEGDPEQLNLTEFTQPALLAASVAIWRVWSAAGGVRPGAMAGHSLGEFSALCCAGALSLKDAVTLVRERGRFMQTAVPVGVGAMAAILGLDDDVVTACCDELSAGAQEIVQAVNFNAPGQVVIAGHSAAVEKAIAVLKESGAKRAMPLPVSAPFHTSLMRPAGEKLAEVLDGIAIASPEIPVVHNVNAATETDPETIRQLLVEQIAAPVLWTSCVSSLQSMGATQFAECGAGKVLGGLLRRIDKSLGCVYLENPDDLRAAATALAQ
ncbi:ACP S-malonyltransferase [Congregibacter litoralis]|uniref:Malonyl CoA-acyl carrier protein transacylase n=1 Tax=Congregibacter litoralis KT71 TaxID=314285 RepID=A4A8E9_9GAMM|nr:ACP S-malonyltransferase [Congregibacter litoralis]EAQ97944.1 [Acyl-carrier-protein] S-malonyltransferase [Congregibacter litoralis KT71]